MTIFVHNPYERNKQVFQDIYKVEDIPNKGFKVYKDKDFYKEFPRLCLWWEIKETSNKNNPCEDCLFNYLNLKTCLDEAFKFTLNDGRLVCALWDDRK